MDTEAMTRALATEELHRRGVPIFAGGAPNQTPWPLGPPAVAADGGITVPQMLNQPTRVTAMVQDLSRERFLLDWLFRSAGGVTGGAVVYDQPTANDLYSDRDVGKVNPGAEFPIVTSSRPIPKIAVVEKWGAKVFITDEARDRNDAGQFTNEIRKLTNTIIRKLNQRAIEEIEAVFTALPSQVIPGHNWSTATTLGTSPTAYALQPVGDFVNIQLYNDGLEVGVEHDTLIMNPQERASLQNLYGLDWAAYLQAYGYTAWYVSQRVAAGTAYSLARGQVGQLRIEKPLSSESWRDKDGRELTWIQSSVRPVMYVQQPLAIVKLTGLHG